MAGIRSFIGIPLPLEYQEGLSEIVHRHKRDFRSRMSWTKAGNWHLTLKFLGDVEEGALPDVIAALGALSFAAFTLQAGGCSFFGSAGRPRVLWIGLQQGREACKTLAREIDEHLVPLGFEAEKRPFAAHLTLARIKFAEKDPWAKSIAEIAQYEWPATRIDRFVLWKSELGPGGPSYSEQAVFTAAGKGEG
jgi:2'-5' RNA ligase